MDKLSALSAEAPPFTPLKRNDTSYGGRIAERACPDAPIKRRVTFLEPVEETPLDKTIPPWHLERHDTSYGGWVAERG